MNTRYAGLAIMAALTLGFGIPNAFAVTEPSYSITPINDEISIKKTIIPMYIPEDNEFPWGSVRGQASEYVERYPVIIQIYQDEDPVHFAQVDVKGDGSFEYKFRIRNIDLTTGETTNIFEGHYTVKIFKVIPNNFDKV